MFLFEVSFQNGNRQLVGAYDAMTAVSVVGAKFGANEVVQPLHTMTMQFRVRNMGEMVRIESVDGSGEQRNILYTDLCDSPKPMCHRGDEWHIVHPDPTIKKDYALYKQVRLGNFPGQTADQYYEEIQ